jgi:hypothetical protein
MTEAIDWSKRNAKPNNQVFELRPLLSPLESLRRRGQRSIEATSWRGWTEHLSAKWGKAALGGDPQRLYELGKIHHNISPKEAELIDELSTAAKGSVDKVEELRKLSPEGRRAFLERRLIETRSREELVNVINKYEPEFGDFFPARRRFDGEINPLHVKPAVATIAGVGDVELPDYMVREIDQLTRPLFNSPELRKIMRAYDTLNNAWKSAVTVFWPAFHVRNLYSNNAQVLVDISLGALDPKAHAEAVRILARSKGTVNIGGIDYVRNRIHDTFKDAGIIIPGNAYLEYTGEGAGRFTKIGVAASKLSPAKYARQFGGLIENEARVQFALQWMRRGATLEEAAKRTNKFLFDYTNGLTRVERELFKRIIPFYTWQSKNMRLMFDNLRKRPGLLAAELKPVRGRHSEDEQMTSWNAENLKLRLDGDGKTVRMLQGVDLPITNLDIIWSGNIQSTAQQLAGMVAPFIKAPFEAATGFNLFLGRPLTRKESAGVGRLIEHTPTSVKDWMGYRKEIDAAGKPRYTFDGNRFYLVFQSWMMSRLVSTTDRAFRNYLDKGSPQWQGALLDFGAGLRLREINFDEEQERRVRERTRQLQESLTRRGALATFTKTFKPKYEDVDVEFR